MRHSLTLAEVRRAKAIVDETLAALQSDASSERIWAAVQRLQTDWERLLDLSPDCDEPHRDLEMVDALLSVIHGRIGFDIMALASKHVPPGTEGASKFKKVWVLLCEKLHFERDLLLWHVERVNEQYGPRRATQSTPIRPMPLDLDELARAVHASAADGESDASRSAAGVLRAIALAKAETRPSGEALLSELDNMRRRAAELGIQKDV